MKVITLVDETGALGKVLTLPDAAFDRLVASGQKYIEGRHDKRTHRVDRESGEIVADDKPKPEIARSPSLGERVADIERRLEALEKG